MIKHNQTNYRAGLAAAVNCYILTRVQLHAVSANFHIIDWNVDPQPT